MPRGQTSALGTTMINANGYHHTKTQDGWRLTHQLIVERQLGRPLTPHESVRFVDGDRRNLNPSNLAVVPRGTTRIRQRLAVIEVRIQELKAEAANLEKQLEMKQHKRKIDG